MSLCDLQRALEQHEERAVALSACDDGLLLEGDRGLEDAKDLSPQL